MILAIKHYHLLQLFVKKNCTALFRLTMKFSVHFLEISAQISLNKNQKITFNATNLLLNKDNTIAERIAIYNRKIIFLSIYKNNVFLSLF